MIVFVIPYSVILRIPMLTGRRSSAEGGIVPSLAGDRYRPGVRLMRFFIRPDFYPDSFRITWLGLGFSRDTAHPVTPLERCNKQNGGIGPGLSGNHVCLMYPSATQPISLPDFIGDSK